MHADPEKLKRLQQLLTNKLREHFGESIIDVINALGEVTVVIDRAQILPICRMLRLDPDFQFEFASFITCVDNSKLNKTPRFETVYHLLSLHHQHRVRVRAGIPESDPTIDSVFSIWKTANFNEREVFDMFGIVFKGHPDLRRILMPEDWEGHPLRKEFPLGGVKSFYFKRSTDPRAGEPAELVPRIREQKSDI